MSGAALILGGKTVAAPDKAKRLVLVWLDGGPSPFETFNPVINGSRGPMGTIACPESEAVISEWLPLISKQMKHLTLLKAVTHVEAIHDRACKLALSGPAGSGILNRDDAILLGQRSVGFGYASPKRQQYKSNSFRDECNSIVPLLKEGTTAIGISMGGWDTHCDNFSRIKNSLAPELDMHLSKLIIDLRQSGLWEETRLICMGEFGRSPEVNAMAGRDHWPQAGFALMGGVGIPAGAVHGRLDKWFEPSEGAVSIDQVFDWRG